MLQPATRTPNFSIAESGPTGFIQPAIPYAFAFAKGSDELVSAVNAALDEMLADGTVADIFAAWGVSYVAP